MWEKADSDLTMFLKEQYKRHDYAINDLQFKLKVFLNQLGYEENTTNEMKQYFKKLSKKGKTK